MAFAREEKKKKNGAETGTSGTSLARLNESMGFIALLKTRDVFPWKNGAERGGGADEFIPVVGEIDTWGSLLVQISLISYRGWPLHARSHASTRNAPPHHSR